MKTAIVLGATGFTGAQLTAMLLQSACYEKVIIFVRRDSGVRHVRLIQHIVDFDNPDTYRNFVEGDDMFCCLGTTIKQAKTRDNFEKVDLTYPVQFATVACHTGVSRFYLMSSIGADPSSSNFYLRTKGRCEEAILRLPFQAVCLFRPSLLTGKRGEFRLGEKVSSAAMKILSVFMVGRLRKYRPVKAEKVAWAMQAVAMQQPEGVHIFESDAIGKF